MQYCQLISRAGLIFFPSLNPTSFDKKKLKLPITLTKKEAALKIKNSANKRNSAGKSLVYITVQLPSIFINYLIYKELLLDKYG